MDDFERANMVRRQIVARGIEDERVIEAMSTVPRHLFVPQDLREQAYEDHPLPIGYGQTISQPYIVAAMTALAEIGEDHRVLEIGTGSGYQTAVLAALAREVYSIEIVEPLAARAAAILARLGFGNVHVRSGDGYDGWPEAAPFNAIIVTAAPPSVPEPFKAQLAENGKLVIPVGEDDQMMLVMTRCDTKFEHQDLFPVRFVRMTGKIEGAFERQGR